MSTTDKLLECGHSVEDIDYDGDCTACIREGKARKEPFEPTCWGFNSYEHYKGECRHFSEAAQ